MMVHEDDEVPAASRGNVDGGLSKSTMCSGKCIETLVLGVVIVMLWALLALPTVFYHLPQTASVSVAPAINLPVDNISECSTEVYVGEVCQSTLLARQSCIPDLCNSTEVLIPSNTNQVELEQQVINFLSLFNLLNPSQECTEAFVPFLCFFTFRLCDNSSGELHQPSSAECGILTTETCANEFQTAIQLMGSANLPQCQQLPNLPLVDTEECLRTCLEDGSDSTNRLQMTSNEEMPTAVCSEDFYLEEREGGQVVCLPECGKWRDLPKSAEVATDVIAILHSVVYIISASAVLVLSCVQYERMFKFPAIFIFYAMFPLGALTVSFLIGYTDRTKLFCSSRNLIESVRSPTPFCNIQGAIFTYVGLQQTLLWFIHTLALFWGVKFPFHAKIFQKNGYFIYVHILLLAIAIILPVMPVAAAFGTDGMILASFPPYLCGPRNPNVFFYAFVLPASLLLAAGITLIILVFQVLLHLTQNEVHKQTTEENNIFRTLCIKIWKVVKMNSAEAKVFVILCYYFVLAVIVLTNSTIRVIKQPQFFADIAVYFTCESLPGGNCERVFESLGAEVVTKLNYLLFGVYPIVNLLYVLNISDLKMKYLKRQSRSRKMATQRESSTATSISRLQSQLNVQP